jgi:endonuclease/exonuclease/phosphatase family metal-dependent hydrolase
VELFFAQEPVISENYTDLNLEIIARDTSGNATSAFSTVSVVWMRTELALEYGNVLTAADILYDAEKDADLIPQEELDRINSADVGEYEISTTVEGKTLTVMSVHFGLNDDEHALAVDIVRREVEKIENPIIFMGDLNLVDSSRHYAALCEFLEDSAAVSVGCINTFPSPEPNRRIDFLFTKGDIKVIDAHVPDVVVSDHRPFVATVELL